MDRLGAFRLLIITDTCPHGGRQHKAEVFTTRTDEAVLERKEVYLGQHWTRIHYMCKEAHSTSIVGTGPVSQVLFDV